MKDQSCDRGWPSRFQPTSAKAPKSPAENYRRPSAPQLQTRRTHCGSGSTFPPLTPARPLLGWPLSPIVVLAARRPAAPRAPGTELLGADAGQRCRRRLLRPASGLAFRPRSCPLRPRWRGSRCFAPAACLESSPREEPLDAPLGDVRDQAAHLINQRGRVPVRTANSVLRPSSTSGSRATRGHRRVGPWYLPAFRHAPSARPLQDQ
jgi:hypothetical protein